LFDVNRNKPSVLSAIALVVCGMLLASCHGPGVDGASSTSSKSSGGKNGPDGKDSRRDIRSLGAMEETLDTEDEMGTTQPSGTGTPEPDAAIVYPEFAFAGLGSTSNDGDGHETTSRIETRSSETDFTVNQVQARVDVNNSRGQKTADEDIRASALGPTNYRRPNREERARFVDQDGRTRIAPYAMFAIGFVNNKGHQFTMDSPLPVFVWPGKQTRFAALSSGSRSWSATVTGQGKSIPVDITVSRVGGVGDEIVVQFDTLIRTDQAGELYELLPWPKTAKFTVNVAQQHIAAIDSNYVFFADSNRYSSRRLEQTNMNYRLCTVKRGTAVQSVGGC